MDQIKLNRGSLKPTLRVMVLAILWVALSVQPTLADSSRKLPTQGESPGATGISESETAIISSNVMDLLGKGDLEGVCTLQRQLLSIQENGYGKTHWKAVAARVHLEEYSRVQELDDEKQQLYLSGYQDFLRAQQHSKNGEYTEMDPKNWTGLNIL